MNSPTLHKHHQPWVNVAVFEDPEAARSVEKFFDGKGLEARTYDDKLFRAFLFLRPPRKTYRVQVRQGELFIATGLLEACPPPAIRDALHCPSCHSLAVNYPQMTRHFLLPTIILHVGIILHILDHECYCHHCHNVWDLPKAGEFRDPEPAGHLNPS